MKRRVTLILPACENCRRTVLEANPLRSLPCGHDWCTNCLPAGPCLMAVCVNKRKRGRRRARR